MSENGRTMFFHLVYNWLTKKKEIFIDFPAGHPEDPKIPEHREYGENESLYQCEITLPTDSRGKTGVKIQSVEPREEWDTAPKKPEKQSMVMWLAQQIFRRGSRMAPPHSFGPGNPFQGALDEKKPVVRFVIDGKKYKVVVSKDEG